MRIEDFRDDFPTVSREQAEALLDADRVCGLRPHARAARGAPGVSAGDRTVASDAPTAPHAEVEATLRALAAGRDPGPLEVTYTDLHGLWGGVAVTLTADGACTLTTREAGGGPVVQRRQLDRAEVAAVARLLLELEAWVQRIPERTLLIPDESDATLTIRCAGAAVSIWEPYNDLARLGRLVRVRERLLSLAAPPHP